MYCLRRAFMSVEMAGEKSAAWINAMISEILRGRFTAKLVCSSAGAVCCGGMFSSHSFVVWHLYPVRIRVCLW